eukprot:TRINITY_DN15982_c0_g1_i1.p1 TRINITY_DN15982_c0_g1~~TRINITY_DN15982_c0_g1_i1.p1  ORF type:complete len:115 (-),score=26.53 TRINITY_DN15982_c0_g1_i1:82-426(-)
MDKKMDKKEGPFQFAKRTQLTAPKSISIEQAFVLKSKRIPKGKTLAWSVLWFFLGDVFGHWYLDPENSPRYSKIYQERLALQKQILAEREQERERLAIANATKTGTTALTQKYI